MSDNRARVSLCMIVRNEQANLDDCLSPVAGFFDEIVIVDTGSVDRTREIARSYTPHVYDFPWCDDFSTARNASLRRASGEWIFWLDADDRIRPPQIDRLRGILERLDGQPRVMMMDTVLLPREPQDDLQYVTHPRLFRAHSEPRWHGRVHEQILPDLARLGYEFVFTDVQIEHVGYTDQALSERKARRKLRLLQMDYAVDPNDPCTLLHLGMSLSCTRRTEEARRCLTQVIDSDEADEHCLRCAYHGLASLASSTGKPREALHFSARGLSRFPDDGQLLYSRALAFYALYDFSNAAAVLEQLIHNSLKRTWQFTMPANLQTKLAPRLLGSVRRLQGRAAEAISMLNGVLQNFPADSQTWYQLGLIAVDEHSAVTLQSIVDNLQRVAGGSPEAGMLVALWHLRNGNPAQAGPLIDSLIAMKPDSSRPRMLRSELLSIMNAPLDEQIRALRDVLRLMPGSLEARHWIDKLTHAKPAALQPAVVMHSTYTGMMPAPISG